MRNIVEQLVAEQQRLVVVQFEIKGSQIYDRSMRKLKFAACAILLLIALVEVATHERG